MMAACSATCLGVLAALLAARRSVFHPTDVGCLLRRLDGRLEGCGLGAWRWVHKALGGGRVGGGGGLAAPVLSQMRVDAPPEDE